MEMYNLTNGKVMAYCDFLRSKRKDDECEDSLFWNSLTICWFWLYSALNLSLSRTHTNSHKHFMLAFFRIQKEMGL